MKFRAAASIALAAAVALGAAGCNMISPQRTTIQYDASDGVGVTIGTTELRNVLIIVDDADGTGTATTGSLVAAVVTPLGDAATIDAAVGSSRLQIEAPADETLTRVGYGEGNAQLLIEGVDLPIGGTVEMTFTGPDGSSQTVPVPVLDGTLAEYATLVPTVPATTEPAEPTATETEPATQP